MLELTKHNIPHAQLKDILFAANTQELPIIENALVLSMVEIAEREATADTAEIIGTYQTLINKIFEEHSTLRVVIDAWYSILHSRLPEKSQKMLSRKKRGAVILEKGVIKKERESGLKLLVKLEKEEKEKKKERENYKNAVLSRVKEIITETNVGQLTNEQATTLLGQFPQFGPAIAKNILLNACQVS